MSYMHIENLYKNTAILAFKECYAMEKIHGTSAHVAIHRIQHEVVGGINSSHVEVHYFAGGVDHLSFVKLFDDGKLIRRFMDLELNNIILFGEAYGGKCQGMAHTYGPDLRFVVFEVKINDNWLDVVRANYFADQFGLDFVHWVKIPATLEAINEQRDAESVQALKNIGVSGKMREGVVLRPPFEVTLNGGGRVIAKHKRDEFRETKTTRDPTKNLTLLTEAREIAQEWVTMERLRHVLQSMASERSTKWDISDTGNVINAMIDDIRREAKGEILESKAVFKEVSRATALLYKDFLKKTLPDEKN